MQEQLWNAGEVRIGRAGKGPSHKRKYRICREPGCGKPARAVQGASYCEEHARAIDYRSNGLREEMALKVATECLGCGKSYRRLRVRARHPARG